MTVQTTVAEAAPQRRLSLRDRDRILSIASPIGLLLIWVQSTYRIIRLSGDVYQISYLPMKLTWSDFSLIVGATLVISFLATLSPAPIASVM